MFVPGPYCEQDVSAEVAFNPADMRFLDRIQALAMQTPRAPTPGFIRTLREALGFSQREMTDRLGVDGMTVSRWERGTVRPSADSLKALEKLRKAAARKSVTVAA